MAPLKLECDHIGLMFLDCWLMPDDQEARDDQQNESCRGWVTAQCKSTNADRFVREVARDNARWSGTSRPLRLNHAVSASESHSDGLPHFLNLPSVPGDGRPTAKGVRLWGVDWSGRPVRKWRPCRGSGPDNREKPVLLMREWMDAQRYGRLREMTRRLGGSR
jgi:hypothetical protein